MLVFFFLLACRLADFFPIFISSNSCCRCCCYHVIFKKSFLRRTKTTNTHSTESVMHNQIYESEWVKKSNYNNNVKSIRCFTFLLRMIIIYCAPLHAIRASRHYYRWFVVSLIIPISVLFFLLFRSVLFVLSCWFKDFSSNLWVHELCRLCCSNSINLINRF